MNDIGVMKPIISVVSSLLFVLSPSSPLLASLCLLYCGHVLQILKYLFFFGHIQQILFPSVCCSGEGVSLSAKIYLLSQTKDLSSSVPSSVQVCHEGSEEAKPTLLVFLALCFHLSSALPHVQ